MAKKKGQIIAIPAKANQLQIDIDEKDCSATRINWSSNLGFSRIIYSDLCVKYGGAESIFFTTSRSGNLHITITLQKNIPLLDRIFYQLALGDDPVRACHNWHRAKHGSRHPVLFFEKVLDTKTAKAVIFSHALGGRKKNDTPRNSRSIRKRQKSF